MFYVLDALARVNVIKMRHNRGMVHALLLMTCVSFGLTKADSYDLARHATFLDKQFASVRQTSKNLEHKKISGKDAVSKLGAVLGESRKLQVSLTIWMQQQDAPEGKKTLKIILAHSLFEAFLSSQILALDGDSESKQLAKALELKLMKTIPALRG